MTSRTDAFAPSCPATVRTRATSRSPTAPRPASRRSAIRRRSSSRATVRSTGRVSRCTCAGSSAASPTAATSPRKGCRAAPAWRVRLGVVHTRGALLVDEDVATDPFGMFSRDVALAAEPSLGTCTVQAEIDRRTFSQSFDVLAYRKPDVLADVDPEKRAYLSGDA